VWQNIIKETLIIHYMQAPCPHRRQRIKTAVTYPLSAGLLIAPRRLYNLYGRTFRRPAELNSGGKMKIRLATMQDSFVLSALLTELGYANTEDFIERRLAQMMDDRSEHLLIAERDGRALGFLSLHFIPQLALAGDFARLSYFCIADGKRSEGVGQQLLKHAEQLAKDRGCDRVEVHCHEHRTKALAFYAREGYSESPRYLIKALVD